MKINYTKPVLAKGKFWYVKFFYNGKEIRKKEGLNRIKDLKEREEAGELLCAAYLIALKQGYNPTEKKQSQPLGLTLSQALDFGLKQKEGKANSTIGAYKGAVNAFKASIEDLGYDCLLLADTKRIHIKAILDNAKQTLRWSKKNSDKNLTYIQAILAESVKKFYIEVNPAHKIPFENDEKGKSKVHAPATPQQHKKIMECLKQHPNFLNFVSVEYHTGMRPFEILQVQLYMIDLVQDKITLPAEICKDNEERHIPINKHLRQMFVDLEVFNYPKDFYLFGSFRTSGRGNVGHQPDFIPAPTKIKEDTANKRWKKLIIDGLGIKVTMYSYKKFGVNAKLAAGMSMQAIGGLLGHSDEKTTRIYATDLYKEVAKEVYALSPDFV